VYGFSPGRIKNVVLLAGSLIFYAFGDPENLLLLMLSVMVNYFFGLHLERRGSKKRREQLPARTGTGQGQRNQSGQESKFQYRKKALERKRRMFFVIAILSNVVFLAVFKLMRPNDLPLGISFYTFQSLSYLIDVYRGDQERETSFVKYATYITMFPQLLSGPIVCYGEVREAMYSRKFTAKGIQEGLKVFTLGMCAKVLLADTIGLLWRDVQVTGFESISTQLAWLAAIAYSMMLYFDFCGYSLMAIGLGRMLGFELPVNFHTPYLSTTVREFYRRWHMTLGRWFTKYVYISLGGNRRGEFRTICNLLAVWLLTAVWHGSTVNFLIWGMMLWLAIVLERLLEKLGVLKLLEKGPGRLVLHLYLWVVIPITWMCFAIADVEQLQIYLGRMFGVVPGFKVSAGDWRRALGDYGPLLAAGMFACTSLVQKLFRRFKDTYVGSVILVALFWLCVWRLQRAGQNPFQYLKF